MDLQHLKSLARDRWPALLQAAGIDAAFLRKKHGPCPVCGGKDRFRFTDRDGRGCFVCNHHRPDGGDGFQLLADWLRCDFLGAARWVADHFGGNTVAAAVDPAELARRAEREQAEQQRLWAKARARNAALWQEAQPVDADSPAGLYLAGRGLVLDHYPKALRFHPALPYWHQENGEPVLLGYFPALLAAVQAADGTPVALHKTYLDADGHKADVPSVKKWSSPSGTTRGATVRLYPAGPQLAITEGIETALAVHCANGLPVWAGLSAYGMAQAVLPADAVEVFVFADHDDNGTGQQAADTLAGRLLAEGRTVRVLLPSSPGRDWLDVLEGGRA
ncbi:toprim domain-containing protein [Jeongeupia sp. USM3]|uniref:DUF7146 domain-containing protein n=1 Tax=Jeongeupia sp. USM3 TaxID=1906741 RepID=UPI00089DEB0A|nr:toprim domain-containing protein [Jeongeupia sp. USM3]AOY02368.1 hypothetical protein BJP62_14755 [Jeongeupia sp. USM3]